jgi:hypothetical protein
VFILLKYCKVYSPETWLIIITTTIITPPPLEIGVEAGVHNVDAVTNKNGGNGNSIIAIGKSFRKNLDQTDASAEHTYNLAPFRMMKSQHENPTTRIIGYPHVTTVTVIDPRIGEGAGMPLHTSTNHSPTHRSRPFTTAMCSMA